MKRSYAKSLKEYEAPFEFDAPEHEVWVDCDLDQLTRALACLLDNAFRFSPAQRPVALSAQHFEDGSVCIKIDDDGPGIPTQKLCHLLSPMSQMDQQDTYRHTVDGLGLAVAKFIAEAHGGKLTIQSAMGGGTTACIYLPADLISLTASEYEAA